MIRQFGFTNPIIVDEEGVIVAGHGRHGAAKLLGLEGVPVIPITDLTEAELRAYALADNRIAQNAGKYLQNGCLGAALLGAHAGAVAIGSFAIP